MFADYRNSIPFKEQTSRYFNVLFSSVADPSPNTGTHEFWRNLLDSEGENLKYYAVNTKDNGLIVTNIEGIEGDTPSVIGSDECRSCLIATITAGTLTARRDWSLIKVSLLISIGWTVGTGPYSWCGNRSRQSR